MKKLLLCALLAGCAPFKLASPGPATPPRNPQGPRPCLAEAVPPRAQYQAVEGPEWLKATLPNGDTLVVMRSTVTAESAENMARYVLKLEEQAKHAATECVAK